MHCFSLLGIFVVQLQKNNKFNRDLETSKLIGVFQFKEQSRHVFTSGQIIYENKNFGTNSYGCATFFLESDYRRINIQEKRSGPSEIMGHISVVDFIYIIQCLRKCDCNPPSSASLHLR